MASPLQFDIPHTLGRDEAKRRIEAGLPKLERHIPGGGTVEATWKSDYQLAMKISTMGQTVSTDLLIEDATIKASVVVPMMLAMIGGAISGFVKTSAEKMLAPPKDPTAPA